MWEDRGKVGVTNVIFLDIETAPAGECPPAPEEHLARVGNATKPETVERKRAENLANWPDAWAKQASLDWRLGRIVCLGMAQDDGPVTVTRGNERDILIDLWRVFVGFAHIQVVGFGLKSFDWPWILGRSAVVGVKPTRILNTGRYNTSDLVDWQDILCGYGELSMTGWSLDAYAELFQTNFRPWGRGSDIAGWVASGDTDSIRRHCESDIHTTRDLDRICRPVWLGK